MWWTALLTGTAEATNPAPDRVFRCAGGCLVERIAAGEFDGDGIDDLLVSWGNDWWFVPGGVAGFGAAVLTPLDGDVTGVGDVNGDGADDAILIDSTAAGYGLPVEVWFGGAGFPGVAPDQVASTDRATLAVADFDGDGFDDVALNGVGYQPIRVRYGSPAGLGRGVAIGYVYSWGELAAADGTGDGFPDVFVLTQAELARYPGGAGGVSTVADLTFRRQQLSYGNLMPARGRDFDGNGHEDLLFMANSGGQLLLSGAGGMAFGPLDPAVRSAESIPDQDGDGDAELWVGEPFTGLHGAAVFLWGGAPPSVRFAARGRPGGLSWAGSAVTSGDFDGDGALDVATTEGGTVVVYLGP